MTAPVRQGELVPVEVPTATSVVSMFERLATNKDVDVVKLEKLIEMQERILRHNAKAEFWQAFAQMQGELPTISEKGEIIVNGQIRSRYARNEDIQEVVRPVLQKHGFALSFRHEFADGHVKIIGVLAHGSGHSEQDEFIAKADTSGSKNDIQALGSTRSYGQRYTTIALLNIVSRGEDDDGAGANKGKHPPAPEGYDDWLLDLTAVADCGTAPLKAAWTSAKAEFRSYLTATDPNLWNTLKAKAAKVQP